MKNPERIQFYRIDKCFHRPVERGKFVCIVHESELLGKDEVKINHVLKWLCWLEKKSFLFEYRLKVKKDKNNSPDVIVNGNLDLSDDEDDDNEESDENQNTIDFSSDESSDDDDEEEEEEEWILK